MDQALREPEAWAMTGAPALQANPVFAMAGSGTMLRWHDAANRSAQSSRQNSFLNATANNFSVMVMFLVNVFVIFSGVYAIQTGDLTIPFAPFKFIENEVRTFPSQATTKDVVLFRFNKNFSGLSNPAMIGAQNITLHVQPDVDALLAIEIETSLIPSSV